ncbi:MAG: hypothetical protein RIC56_19920 [Pseudomonadales bacterium]
MRMPAARRWSAAIGTLILLILGLFMAAVALAVVIAGERALSLFIGFIAALIFFLVQVTGREWRALWGWKIVVEPDVLNLKLPAARSLTHRPGSFHGRLPVASVVGIDHRLEAYRSLGMANMQRSFTLRLRDGRRILLGEDRGLGSGMATTFIGECASLISERYGLPLRDLGMAEGRGGVLSLVGAAAPAWDAPALDDDARVRLWRRASATGRLVGAVVLIVLILQAVF